MSGVPGAGKSAVAQELVRILPLVALDHDVVKSAVLDGGGTFDLAGPMSYRVIFALADQFLAQGHGVIVDSPCLYDELLRRGQDLADRHRVPYRYIECVTDDIELLDQRLRSRPPLRSQRPSVYLPPRDLGAGHDETGAALFRDWMAQMKRPERYLRLDTTRALRSCVDEAMAFLDAAQE
jgi:predicted kinase